MAFTRGPVQPEVPEFTGLQDALFLSKFVDGARPILARIEVSLLRSGAVQTTSKQTQSFSACTRPFPGISWKAYIQHVAEPADRHWIA